MAALIFGIIAATFGWFITGFLDLARLLEIIKNLF